MTAVTLDEPRHPHREAGRGDLPLYTRNAKDLVGLGDLLEIIEV